MMDGERSVAECEYLVRSLRRRIAACRNGFGLSVAGAAAVVETERLLQMLRESAVDGAMSEEALAAVVDFELCRCRVVEPELAEQIYVHAVNLMVPLMQFNLDRVPKVFWSQVRWRLLCTVEQATDDAGLHASEMAGCLNLLEAMLDRYAEEGKIDVEALQVVGMMRWSRFRDAATDVAWLELRRCIDAFERAARVAPVRVPPLIEDYCRHLTVARHRLPMFRGRWSGAAREHLPLLGRAVLMAFHDLGRARPEDRAPAEVALCKALMLRYMASGHRDDLDEAVRRLDMFKSGSLPRDSFVTAVVTRARALVARADLDGTVEDAELAFDVLEQAMEGYAADQTAMGQLIETVTLVAVVAATLTDDAAPLARAVALLDRDDLLRVLPGGDRSHRRTVLLLQIFQLTGELPVIDRAISEGEQAVSALDLFDPKCAERLFSLAQARHTRFRATKTFGDLNEAIRDVRQAIKRSEEGRAPWMGDRLAQWLLERHGLTRDANDVKEAAATFLEVCHDRPWVGAEVARNAIGMSLNAELFDEQGLRHAIDVCRQMAAEAHASADTGAAHWHHLVSGALGQLARMTGNGDHLDEAVGAAREAVALSTASADLMVVALSRLLLRRSRPADVDEAVTLLPDIISRIDDDPTSVAELRMLVAAGHLLQCQTTGDPARRRLAVKILREVATSAAVHPQVRGDAAYFWAKEAAEEGDFASATAAYAICVALITEHVRRPIRPAEQYAFVDRWAAAARDGAACAIRDGQPETALRLLEHGRGVRVTQTLQRRSELAGLRRERPDLAVEMQALLNAIEGYDKGDRAEIFWDHLQGTESRMFLSEHRTRRMFDSIDPLSILRDRGKSTRLAEELLAEQNSEDTRVELSVRWDEFMERVRRELPHLRLGSSPDTVELIRAVPEGAVVVINVSRLGCDALIVHGGRIDVLALDELTFDDVNARTWLFLQTTLRFEAGDRSPAFRTTLRKTLGDMQSWLWDAVAAPMLDALGHDGPPPEDSTWPRIWWCPTGALSALPIHAAGRLTRDGRGPCVLDRVVSSYTTTLGALWRATTADRDNGTTIHPRALGVAVPNIEGRSPLQHTDIELDALAPWIPEGQHPMVGDDVTINSVTAQLGRHEWVHFACHGAPPVPGRSPAQLFLSNNVLSVNRLAWLTGVRAELAYLSACHTAFGSFAAIDEAEHLTAAFQATGFRHVVGTLWGTADHAAARVATNFYRVLRERGGGAAAAAVALHEAVRAEREAHPTNTFLWAPFVHFGP